MVLRVPVAFALGLACLPVLIHRAAAVADGDLQQDVQGVQLVHPARGAVLPAHANLMNVGGITDRLVTLSRTMVGNFPGALAQINVLLSVFFAGISGSSTADAASQGKIFIEAQVKEGYDLSFSIAITAVSAVLAVIIPPSILMVVWGGVLSGVDRRALPRRRDPGAADRPRADGDRCTSTPSCATTRRIRARRSRNSSRRRCDRDPGADDAVHHRRRHPARLVHRHRIGGGRGASTPRCCRLASTARWTARSCGTRCSRPASCPRSRCSASAPRRCSAGCSPTTRSRRRCSPTSRRGAWASSASASSSRSCSSSSAASSTPFPAIIIVGTTLQPLAASVDMHPVSFAIIGIVALAFGLVTPPYGLCLMISCAIAKVRLRYALKDTMIMLVPDAAGAGRADHLAGDSAVPAASDLAGVPEVAREVCKDASIVDADAAPIAHSSPAGHRR